MDPASFVPGVSKEVVIGKSIDGVGKALIGKETSNLEARATVGLYTGQDNRGNSVEERKVWLVVVDDLPMTVPSGQYTSPENRLDRSGQRQQNQLVVFYDADTGEENRGGCHRAPGLTSRGHRVCQCLQVNGTEISDTQLRLENQPH